MKRYAKKLSKQSELAVICALESKRKQYLGWANDGGIVADYWAKQAQEIEQAILEIKEDF